MGSKSAGSEGCLSCVIVFCCEFVNYGRKEFVGKLNVCLGTVYRQASQSNVFAKYDLMAKTQAPNSSLS